jgi:hypothetical protein
MGSQTQPIKMSFSPSQKIIITDRNTPQHRGYMCSAVVKLVGGIAKLSKNMLEAVYGREINIQF